MARVFIVAIIVVVLLGVAWGSYAWIRGQQPDGPAYELVPVIRGKITEKALAIGQIEPRDRFHVKSKISGIVSRCLVEVGDAVRPGDPLFEIAPDPTPGELVQAERALEKAQSAHRHTQAEYRRYQQLADQGVVAREELERQREAFEQARISLGHAQDSLDLVREGRVASRGQQLESTIRAPAAGIVLARPVNRGDPIVPLTSYQAGTEMATVADMSDLVFKGTVDEIDVGKLRVGMPARLQIGALPSAEVEGRLSRIAPQAIERDGARLFEVEIEIESSGAITLRAGYSATVDLVIKEKSEAPLLPERLVTFSEDGEKAWVELPPESGVGEPQRVEIETGLSDGLNIEIVSGIEAGQQVVERPPREIGG